GCTRLHARFPPADGPGLLCRGSCVEADEILRVGISPFAPCVMCTDRGPEGAAIEARQVIARTLGVASECVARKSSADTLEQSQAGVLEVAIGGISITEEREWHFDFPIRTSGSKWPLMAHVTLSSTCYWRSILSGLVGIRGQHLEVKGEYDGADPGVFCDLPSRTPLAVRPPHPAAGPLAHQVRHALARTRHDACPIR